MADKEMEEASKLESEGKLEEAADVYEKEGLTHYAEILRENAAEEKAKSDEE